MKKFDLPSWNGAAKLALGTYIGRRKISLNQKTISKKPSSVWKTLEFLPSIANLAKIGLLRCKVADNERDINLETLFAYSKNNRLMISEGFCRRWISDILSHINGQYLSEAESWINQAIEADRRNGINFFLGRDYLSYADLLTKKGDRSKARENLGKAIETFKECGADGWVEKAEMKLAEIA